MKKYLFEFFVIFFGITAAFSLDLWRDNMNENEETQKSLTYIKLDLQRDTSLYRLRLKYINRNTEYLAIGLKDTTPTVEELKKNS